MQRQGWIAGEVPSPVGNIPRVHTELTWSDWGGNVARRWAIGRSGYVVPPGLYAVGNSGPESPVLVSANYKLSFDKLRSELHGLDAWILVLNTKGVNVWCAAGKGTFGTEELIHRIQQTQLAQVVTHRELIVPQLGAPGITGYEVQARSRFKVTYGPVRAADIKAFLAAGKKASAEMRRVRFTLADRLAVAPVELVQGGGKALLIAALFVILGGVSRQGFELDMVLSRGLVDALVVMASFVAGALLTPALLPWIPGAAFAWKGFVMGLVTVMGVWLGSWGPVVGIGWVALAGWLLMGSALASFTAMNFTGASTYTSLSGVRKEMRVAVPLQLAAVVCGLALWAVARFW